MDPVSQGVVGCVLAQSVSPRERVRAATIAGIVGGMLADLDVIIKSSGDPMLAVQFHRHFTHSLVFIPIGGLWAAGLAWILVRRHCRFRDLIPFGIAAYATSGLLDACTSYGTHLLWPFSDARTAWGIIAIVDPVFTFTLVGLAAAAAIRRSPRLARVAVVFALAYLMLGVAQRGRARGAQLELARERGHTIDRATVKPSVLSLLLWRSIYEADGRFYVDGFRVPPFAGPRHFQGASVEKLSLESQLERVPPGSALASDFTRFFHFSDDWVAYHPQDPGVLGDVRYAIVPYEIAPLWGIRPDFDQPQVHSPFEYIRALTPGRKQQFRSMLLGSP